MNIARRLSQLEAKTLHSSNRPRRWVRIIHNAQDEAEAYAQLRADGYDISPGSKDFVISPLFGSLLDGPNDTRKFYVLTAGDRSSPPTESELRGAEEFVQKIKALAARLSADTLLSAAGQASGS